MGGRGVDAHRRGKEPILITGGYRAAQNRKWPLAVPFSGMAGRKFIGTMMALFREPTFKGPIFGAGSARKGAVPANGYNFHLKGKPARKTGGVLGPNGWVTPPRVSSRSSASSPAAFPR